MGDALKIDWNVMGGLRHSELIFKSQCSGSCQTKAGRSQWDQVPGNQPVKLERRSRLWMWDRQGQHLKYCHPLSPTLEEKGLGSGQKQRARSNPDLTSLF